MAQTHHNSNAALSLEYFLALSTSAVLDLCKGETCQAQDVLAVIRKVSKMPTEERYSAVCMDGIAVQEQVCTLFPRQCCSFKHGLHCENMMLVQSVKSLVEMLWTPNVPCTVRAHAAELIRRKSLTLTGLEEIRNIAGLESLIKLVDEGLPAEKVPSSSYLEGG